MTDEELMRAAREIQEKCRYCGDCRKCRFSREDDDGCPVCFFAKSRFPQDWDLEEDEE